VYEKRAHFAEDQSRRLEASNEDAKKGRRSRDAGREEAIMAMTMSGEATLPAARPKVWTLLNDPNVLKACIPGCESLERTDDNGFAAIAKVKIGPVSATFKGKVNLSDIVPDVGYTITGEGEGGIAGFAKGAAKVALADAEGGGTLLRYDVEAHVGGKIAQLGSRLIDGVAKGMADKFFASFAAAAAAASTSAEVTRAQVAPPAQVSGPAKAPAPANVPPAAATAREAPPAARQAPLQQAIPANKSWFRRIWEWFMSR
jgi:uncharacterized protein